MDIPGMFHRILFYRSYWHPRNVTENVVLQKPWTCQECYTGFCSIEAMDMPGMLQRILLYRSHGHLRNVTYDLLYISIDV
jgi:hypothetical protein